jgi:uncharacterized membrane protein
MGKRKRKRDKDAKENAVPRNGAEIVVPGQHPLDRPAPPPDGQVRQGELISESGSYRSTRFSGPLPSPATLHEFEQVLPGLAERIVRMAEQEAEHRRLIERRLVGLSWAGLASAVTLCLIALVGGMILLWQGKSLSGLAPIILAMGGLITTLILQRNSSPPADTRDDDTGEDEADDV